MTAQYFIEKLNLVPHPEGGFYKQTYCSHEHIPVNGLPPRFSGRRPLSTAIYYLLRENDYSAFHRIKSDECWHFYAGGTLLVHVIEENGKYLSIRLGNSLQHGDLFQFVVPATSWFAVEPASPTAFALTGCTVAPGFDFEDFEMGRRTDLMVQFPQYERILAKLCRE